MYSDDTDVALLLIALQNVACCRISMVVHILRRIGMPERAFVLLMIDVMLTDRRRRNRRIKMAKLGKVTNTTRLHCSARFERQICTSVKGPKIPNCRLVYANRNVQCFQRVMLIHLLLET